MAAEVPRAMVYLETIMSVAVLWMTSSSGFTPLCKFSTSSIYPISFYKFLLLCFHQPSSRQCHSLSHQMAPSTALKSQSAVFSPTMLQNINPRYPTSSYAQHRNPKMLLQPESQLGEQPQASPRHWTSSFQQLFNKGTKDEWSFVCE